MLPKLFPILPFALLSSLLAPLSSAYESQEHEYQQVRTIALRDPKVKAAYAEAERKLEAKIIQIDPTLATHARTRKETEHEIVKTPKKPAKVADSAHVSPPPAGGKTHVVIKGDTLGSIAAIYGVTAASLKTANQIVDEKKLRVGQKLVIPAGAKGHAPEKKKNYMD